MHLTEENLKILICCHKPCTLPRNKVFLPVQAGAAISQYDLGMQRDDQINGLPCDNISNKNPLYAELTVLYWAWKNIKILYPNLEYIGLNHYRRFFSIDKQIAFDSKIICNENKVSSYAINFKHLKKISNSYDCIIAKRTTANMPVLYCLLSYCNGEDYKSIRETVQTIYPEYASAFHYVWEVNSRLSPCNMFIMKYDTFCQYCEWLFGICFKVENQIPYQRYKYSDKRVLGIMSEVLFNVYLIKNKNTIKCKQLPVILYTDTVKQRNMFFRMLKYARDRIAVHLIAPFDKNKQYI